MLTPFLLRLITPSTVSSTLFFFAGAAFLVTAFLATAFFATTFLAAIFLGAFFFGAAFFAGCAFPNCLETLSTCLDRAERDLAIDFN